VVIRQRRYVRFNEVLGRGAYKTVYRAYDTKEGLLVAWNTISLAGLPKHEKVRPPSLSDGKSSIIDRILGHWSSQRIIDHQWICCPESWF
jgi:hypothetical protein